MKHNILPSTQPMADKCPSSTSHFSAFTCCLSVVFAAWKKGITPNIRKFVCPDKLRSFNRTFYVFGSCFRTLAVTLIWDFPPSVTRAAKTDTASVTELVQAILLLYNQRSLRLVLAAEPQGSAETAVLLSSVRVCWGVATSSRDRPGWHRDFHFLRVDQHFDRLCSACFAFASCVHRHVHFDRCANKFKKSKNSMFTFRDEKT